MDGRNNLHLARDLRPVTLNIRSSSIHLPVKHKKLTDLQTLPSPFPQTITYAKCETAPDTYRQLLLLPDGVLEHVDLCSLTAVFVDQQAQQPLQFRNAILSIESEDAC